MCAVLVQSWSRRAFSARSLENWGGLEQRPTKRQSGLSRRRQIGYIPHLETGYSALVMVMGHWREIRNLPCAL